MLCIELVVSLLNVVTIHSRPMSKKSTPSPTCPLAVRCRIHRTIIGGPDGRLYVDVQATDGLSILPRNDEPGVHAQVLRWCGRDEIRRPPECEDLLYVAVLFPSLGRMESPS